MANEERSVYDVLAEVQHRVTCPKGRVNKFGGYSYRSLEDINAALKPLCKELRCGYVFEDEIVPKRADDGGDPTLDEAAGKDAFRWYLRAKITFWAAGCRETVSATAYAREQVSKKGMDDAQVTGLASSYARKYAACALFAIDSGEEVDAMDNGSQRQKAQNARSGTKTAKPSNTTAKRQTARQEPPQPATQQQTDEILTLVGQLAELKGKTVDEVVSALNKSQHMASLGVAPNAVEYDQIQAATAIRILAAWVEKSK